MRELYFQAGGVSAEHFRRWKTSGRSVAIAVVIVGAVYVADPPAQIKLNGPSNISTRNSVITLTGEVAGARADTVALNVNGSLLAAPVKNGTFAATVPLIPGENMIAAASGSTVSSLMGSSSVVRIFADIKAADIWTQLSWDGPGDIDLHLRLPNNEHCYYERKATPSGAILDIDNRVSNGPEHIVMERAVPGAYRLSVLYYKASGQPPRTVAWQVIVRLRNKELQRFSGTLSSENQEQDVTTFNF